MTAEISPENLRVNHARSHITNFIVKNGPEEASAAIRPSFVNKSATTKNSIKSTIRETRPAQPSKSRRNWSRAKRCPFNVMSLLCSTRARAEKASGLSWELLTRITVTWRQMLYLKTLLIRRRVNVSASPGNKLLNTSPIVLYIQCREIALFKQGSRKIAEQKSVKTEKFQSQPWNSVLYLCSWAKPATSFRLVEFSSKSVLL